MPSTRRYQVFISSTYTDLLEERQAVVSTLLESDAFPAGMELFPATNDDAWTLIRKVIDESDYYLLVIGGRYGSIDPSDDTGYTEKEYDYAIETEKPVMAFLHGSPGRIPAELTERGETGQEKLAAFRSKVEASRHVKYWQSTEGLAGQVSLSYHRLIREFPGVGWMRADRAASEEMLERLTAADERIRTLESQVSAQSSDAPVGSKELAQGDDEHRWQFEATVMYTSKTVRFATKRSVWVTAYSTWNELFGAIGPLLLDECSEPRIRRAFQDWAKQMYWGETTEAVEESLTKFEQSTDGLEISRRDVMIDDEDLGTILVQFKALGLITKSQRKRSVNDRATYWTLTPYGETLTTQLRAIKKAPPPDTVKEA